jgi:branched-chain amino acid transport system permease protein
MSVYVTMLVIGGLGSSTRPIIGTILVQIVATALVTHPGEEYTVLGLFPLVVVIFVPEGLTGLIARYWRRISAWVAEDGKPGGSAPGSELPAEREGSIDPHVA